jgi:hypothetical protein
MDGTQQDKEEYAAVLFILYSFSPPSVTKRTLGSVKYKIKWTNLKLAHERIGGEKDILKTELIFDDSIAVKIILVQII